MALTETVSTMRPPSFQRKATVVAGAGASAVCTQTRSILISPPGRVRTYVRLLSKKGESTARMKTSNGSPAWTGPGTTPANAEQAVSTHRTSRRTRIAPR